MSLFVNMQIRLTRANEKKLKKISDASLRSITIEANIAIEQNLSDREKKTKRLNKLRSDHE